MFMKEVMNCSSNWSNRLLPSILPNVGLTMSTFSVSMKWLDRLVCKYTKNHAALIKLHQTIKDIELIVAQSLLLK